MVCDYMAMKKHPGRIHFSPGRSKVMLQHEKQLQCTKHSECNRD